ncbi:MAG: hypothetical protein M3463_13785, partial [Verrucomicrobiota bacterium]|nr:hypothetical protein [Verrucomicrobiota bacterium]
MRDLLKSEIATLRSEGVTLTDADFEPLKDAQPPQAVAAAGPEFVAAWREYRRAMSLKKKSTPLQARAARGKNIVIEGAEYSRLMEQLLSGAKPPLPDELAPFYYNDFNWCGTDMLRFAHGHSQAVLLAALRHKHFGDALQMAMPSSGESELLADLLTALGFNWRKVLIGAWLDG